MTSYHQKHSNPSIVFLLGGDDDDDDEHIYDIYDVHDNYDLFTSIKTSNDTYNNDTYNNTWTLFINIFIFLKKILHL